METKQPVEKYASVKSLCANYSVLSVLSYVGGAIAIVVGLVMYAGDPGFGRLFFSAIIILVGFVTLIVGFLISVAKEFTLLFVNVAEDVEKIRVMQETK